VQCFFCDISQQKLFVFYWELQRNLCWLVNFEFEISFDVLNVLRVFFFWNIIVLYLVFIWILIVSLVVINYDIFWVTVSICDFLLFLISIDILVNVFNTFFLRVFLVLILFDFIFLWVLLIFFRTSTDFCSFYSSFKNLLEFRLVFLIRLPWKLNLSLSSDLF
jgi:hypothetical protein